MAECDAERIDPETHRAAQDVPEKTRRYVHRRDGGRCHVPGCRATRHLDIHHVVPRACGGNHLPENLILLCSGHHRAHHDGKLAISGSASKLEIRELRQTDNADLARDAELALRTAGFKPREARDAVTTARAHVGTSTTLEVLIREALRRCAKPSG